MKTAEKNLLLAVRNLLQTAVVSGGAGYSTSQCQIEATDDAPATVGDVYVIVGPLGWQPGPRHRTSGTVRDLIYSVGIMVAKRITHVPRDRQDQAFAIQAASLNAELDKCFAVIDWSWALTAAANVLILADAGSSEGFIHPLVFEGMDAKPRILGGEFFGAGKEPAAGLGRLMRFGMARRITTI